MPSIRCAHCKETHSSVAEVRECSGIDTRSTDARVPAATSGVFTREPGRAYDRLRDLRRRVSAGHYAVEIGELPAYAEYPPLHFIQVDKPTEGRWAGYTFIKRQEGDNYLRVPDVDFQETILEEILSDPKGAMLRYGKEIGRCGHCHRTLTDPESIERGIGPSCAKKLGW